MAGMRTKYSCVGLDLSGSDCPLNRDKQIVLERLSHSQTSPALRQIRKLASDSDAEVIGSPVVLPAQELLSLWSIRLWNATLRARRIVGLVDLVRALIRLSPERKIEQIAFSGGLKTGIVFFDAQTREPIGGVLSLRHDSDLQRPVTIGKKRMG